MGKTHFVKNKLNNVETVINSKNLSIKVRTKNTTVLKT